MIKSIKRRIPSTLKRRVKRILRNAWESAVYRLSNRPNPGNDVRHIVFVCKGNVCRSAFAEHLLGSILRQNGNAGRVKIESCGLDVDQGGHSPADAVKAGRLFGVDLSRHHSRGISICDLKNADLIVAMECSHFNRLVTRFPEYRNKTVLMRDFTPFPGSLVCNIHDPFGLGEQEFHRCFRLVQKAVEGLVLYMRHPNKHL